MVVSLHISSVLQVGAPTPHGANTQQQQQQRGGVPGQRHPKSRPSALLLVLAAPHALAVGSPVTA